MIVLLENECSLFGGEHTLLLKKELLALSGSGDVKTLSMCPRTFANKPGIAPVIILTLPVPPVGNLYVYKCKFFFKNFWGTEVLFIGPLIPLFWTFWTDARSFSFQDEKPQRSCEELAKKSGLLSALTGNTA